jgi:hypothetical protein
MTVINRSNDMVWGCLGANYVHMSFLQEYIACSLGLKVGLYHQFTNNLHVYEANWFPDKWLSDVEPDPYQSRPDAYPNPPLFRPNLTELSEDPGPVCLGQSDFDSDLSRLFSVWDSSGLSFPDLGLVPWMSPFFKDVVVPLIIAWKLHLSRNYAGAILIAERITHSDWRLACKQWLQRRQFKYENRPRQMDMPGKVHQTSDDSHSEIPPLRPGKDSSA